MDISISTDQIRKSKLKKLINELGYSSLTQFAKAHGFFASNLSPILNGEKKFTDKLARNLEEKLDLPPGYLSKIDAKNEKEYLIGFKMLDKSNKDGCSLIDDGTCFSIDKNTIDEDKFNPHCLFALSDCFEIDKNALSASIEKKSVLVFNAGDNKLIDSKIYLIKFSNQLLLRRYIESSTGGFLEADNQLLYAKISAPSNDIEIIGRLVYQLNLVRF